jgi:hypothetical protein
MGERDVQEPRPSLSRRQLIRRGMVAGGVALWSAPVVAAATFNRRDDGRDRIAAQLEDLRGGSAAGEAAAPGPAIAQQPGCTSYPPGTCLEFVCGGPHTNCGQGAGGFECFCDIDATGACVCRNDAFCSDLTGCNPANGNADCAAGYFCLPSSCCGAPTCAPPCGTLPPGAQPASPITQFLPLLNSILPPGTLSGI